ELMYRYTKESAFLAGNEYLYFENKNIRAAATGVHHIDLKDLYHSYLFTDGPRFNQPYTYNPDINGNFLITAIDTEDPSVEADYAFVHFYLAIPEQLGKTIYVYGNYNNYVTNEENKMTFNTDRGVYEATLLLK